MLQQIIEVGKKEIEIIKVNTGIATVSISSKLLKTDKTDDPSNVRISVDGQKISTFEGNEVKVEVPYTLQAGENPNKVVLYYICASSPNNQSSSSGYD